MGGIDVTLMLLVEVESPVVPILIPERIEVMEIGTLSMQDLAEDSGLWFCLKWWLLVVALAVALIAAIPRRLRSRSLIALAVAMPRLAWRMVQNITHLSRSDKVFLHTTHSGQQTSNANQS